MQSDFQDSATQLMYLIKELLDTPCFTVWMFSPIQSRIIRLTEGKYVQHFETEFQALVRTDENDILRLLSTIPPKNDNCKQTLFFWTFGYLSNSKQSVIEKVNEMLQKRQCDVVMLCWGSDPSVMETENFQILSMVTHLI